MYQAASTLVPSVLSGRIEWVLLHNSYCQSAIWPSAFERRLDAHRHRRAVGLPGEFVVAHPLQPHRPVGNRAGEQRRVERHVVGAVLAVAARAFDMDAADVLRRHLQRLDQFAAQREHALRMGPDDHPAVEERRHRAGRADRGMRQIRLGVGRLERAGVGAGQRRRLLDADDLVLARQRFQMGVDVGGIRQFRPELPLRRSSPAPRAP